MFTPQFTYKPDLISHYKLQTRPMRVTYYIRKNARWGDGVKVTFKRNFAAWRRLFTYVLPQHALQGTDMRTVWNVRCSSSRRTSSTRRR